MASFASTTSHPLASGRPPEWAVEWGQDRFGVFATFEVGEARQRMRWIPPGRFVMGSPADEPERFESEVQHAVELSGFWLADTACTQALWTEVMGENPSRFKGTDRPVETVSHDDVATFLTALKRRDETLDLRLPTEAEWEYACRAGTTTPFSFGAQITPEEVNYDGNHPYARGRKGKYRQETVAVASLPPNPWGLYEMHGNVWEWCADWYGDYPNVPVKDPLGPEAGAERVLRGGSWFSNARYVRSAYRNWLWLEPAARYVRVGFRLARGQGPEQSSK